MPEFSHTTWKWWVFLQENLNMVIFNIYSMLRNLFFQRFSFRWTRLIFRGEPCGLENFYIDINKWFFFRPVTSLKTFRLVVLSCSLPMRYLEKPMYLTELMAEILQKIQLWCLDAKAIWGPHSRAIDVTARSQKRWAGATFTRGACRDVYHVYHIQ